MKLLFLIAVVPEVNGLGRAAVWCVSRQTEGCMSCLSAIHPCRPFSLAGEYAGFGDQYIGIRLVRLVSSEWRNWRYCVCRKTRVFGIDLRTET
ncbi:hypothetical protein GE09DRAFT_573976 [Coniochaeta sp. 2T2.1]|nr:hypothetical protein GE09DRAFT_573976 [Coniochaeta sp. 2T2.1]